MSEFGEKHTVSRLIGSSPGCIGYEKGEGPDRGGQKTSVSGNFVERVREDRNDVFILNNHEP